MKNKSMINRSYLMLLTSVAALGGLLFGFDIAIITGASPFIKAEFELNDIQFGWGVGSLLLGCAIGAIVSGRITDIYGRKSILIIIAALFAVTTILTGIASSFSMFVIARILSGLAVGGASTLSPMYISEIAPSKVRGSLVSFYQLSIVLGILISYLINYLLHDIGENNWRWMFASGSIPSVLFFIMLFLVPETPRFLFKKGNPDEALRILTKICGEDIAKYEFKQIGESLKDKIIPLKSVFKPEVKAALFVGLILAVLVQMSGINTIIDYAPIILQTAKWNISEALFSTFILGIVNLTFTFIAIFTIDRFGRRPLYLIGSAGMTICLGFLTLMQILGRFEGMVVLIGILVFLAFFAACIGPVFWTLISEIFPNKVRGVAMSIAVLTQWVFNFIVVFLFPYMFNKSGAFTFGFLAVMALLQLLFTWRYLPETKGKTLEEIEQLWRK